MTSWTEIIAAPFWWLTSKIFCRWEGSKPNKRRELIKEAIAKPVTVKRVYTNSTSDDFFAHLMQFQSSNNTVRPSRSWQQTLALQQEGQQRIQELLYAQARQMQQAQKPNVYPGKMYFLDDLL